MADTNGNPRPLEAQQTRARAQAWANAKLQAGGVLIALLMFAGVLLVRRHASGFSALPKSEQRFYVLAIGIPVALLLNLAWLLWRKRRTA